MLIVWIFLYFGGFNLFLQSMFFFVSVIILYRFRKTCSFFQEYKQQWNLLKKYEKYLLGFAFVLVLILSVSFSFLPDSETYYIQTVKWGNLRGFVPGLMNIHPFLGQFSGWHILQSGVNIPFLGFRANALNGFLFLLFLYWVVFDKKNFFSFWLKFLVFFVLIGIFVAGTPSPDFPVWLLSLLIFERFIKIYHRFQTNQFKSFVLLVFFSLMIKITAVINLFLLLTLWIKYFQKIKKNTSFILFTGFLSLILILSKNYILTGYLFYPFDFLSKFFIPFWQYPTQLLHHLSELSKIESSTINFNENFTQAFNRWFFSGNLIEHIVHPLMVLALLSFPMLLYYKRKNICCFTTYVFIYVFGLVYFLVILFINPNSRFFLHILLFMLFVGIEILFSKTYIHKIYITGLVTLLISLMISIFFISFGKWQLLIPQQSHLGNTYQTQIKGNLKYHYPKGKDFFWETGDAPIPSFTPAMSGYFEEKFGYFTQSTQDERAYYSHPKKDDNL